MLNSGVYAVIDSDGDMYIGSTRNFKHRWHVHRYSLKKGTHHSSSLQEAWNESGIVSFEILEICDVKDLLATEQRLMDSMKPRHNIYLTAGSAAGMRMSDETKAKISRKLTGRKIPDETLVKRSIAFKGRKVTAEHREKLSLAYPKCAPVRCKETNQIFRSTVAAVRWLKETCRPTASNSLIIKVCKGQIKAAYGYTWEYMGVNDAGD